MVVRRGADVLRVVAKDLLRTLEALRCAKPLELVEAEVEIPFIRTVTGGMSSGRVGDFTDVSLLAEHIRISIASDIWWLRISITKNSAPIVRVERL